MRINTPATTKHFTHEGAPTHSLKPIDELRRSVMATMLWEDSFYEDGVSITNRIEELCPKVGDIQLANLTLECHKKGLMRHMPLFLAIQLVKNRKEGSSNLISGIIEAICTRPDQMTELLAIYWKDGKKPVAAQLKKGLAKAFVKFDAYQLGKWNKDDKIKLKDIIKLCHPKPKDKEQADLWLSLMKGDLKTPETWEKKLSAGEDKKETFQELLEKRKMGLMAILMNVRNMYDVGVPKELVKENLMAKAQVPMLPFKYLAAAMACPQWEDILDAAMIESVSRKDKIPGKTYIFVDVSGSMDSQVSGKSQMIRMDAAGAFAILLRECCQEFDIFTFSDRLGHLAPRRGMGLLDIIKRSQPHSGTNLAASLSLFMKNFKPPYDRIIVITDEQVNAALPTVPCDKKYILNVAGYQNGIGTQDGWLTISGFSEASIDYIRELENFK